MHQLKTHHKIGILAVFIIAIFTIAAGLGTFEVYHHYNTKPADQKCGSTDCTNIEDKVAAKIKKQHNSVWQNLQNIEFSVTNLVPNHKTEFFQDGVYYIDSTNVSPGHGQIFGTGMFTAYAFSSDGSVKTIEKFHNIRTVQGINCFDNIMIQLATTPGINTNGTNVCTARGSVSTSAWGGYNKLTLLNASSSSGTVRVNGSDTCTLSCMGGSRVGTHYGGIITATANEGSTSQGTVASIDSTAANYGTVKITSGTFSFSSTTGMTIGAVALDNSTSATASNHNWFAEASFASPVTFASGDTLIITYQVAAS